MRERERERERERDRETETERQRQRQRQRQADRQTDRDRERQRQSKFVWSYIYQNSNICQLVTPKQQQSSRKKEKVLKRLSRKGGEEEVRFKLSFKKMAKTSNGRYSMARNSKQPELGTERIVQYVACLRLTRGIVRCLWEEKRLKKQLQCLFQIVE